MKGAALVAQSLTSEKLPGSDSMQRLVLPGVVLYCGDCLEILPQLEPVDAVVTDPPYGYNYKSTHVAATTTAAWMRKPIMGDSDTSLRDSVIAWAEGRPWAAFGAWKMPKPEGVRGVLIWDKGPASGMGDLSFPWKGSWEEIYVGGQGWAGHRGEGVIKGHWIVTRASMGRIHPNEKPVPLMGQLLEKLPQGCTVLDPFMGSGSTIIAAIRTGRKAIGIERDPEHFKNAVERIKRELAQGDLFLEQKRPIHMPVRDHDECSKTKCTQGAVASSDCSAVLAGLIEQLAKAADDAREKAKSVYLGTWYSGEETAFRKAVAMARQCQEST